MRGGAANGRAARAREPAFAGGGWPLIGLGLLLAAVELCAGGAAEGLPRGAPADPLAEQPDGAAPRRSLQMLGDLANRRRTQSALPSRCPLSPLLPAPADHARPFARTHERRRAQVAPSRRTAAALAISATRCT